MRLQRGPVLRLLVGVLISAVFLAVTLSRVDLPRAAQAIGSAAPGGMLAALLIVLGDLCLRALRWQVLLHGVEGAGLRPRYSLAFGYLTVGFAANAVLPARLGDVARAVLAAGAFRTPRLAIFGTVMIERISDGLIMLGLAVLSSLGVAGAAELQSLTGSAIVLVLGGLVVAAAGWILVSRSALAGTRIAGAISAVIARVSVGAGALRSAGSALSFVGLSALVTTTAILVAWTVLGAVGVSVTPLQTVLFMSGIALSLAIPAAPGAIGTYEFVGVAIITGLGYTPEQGLATILLMRVVTTFPPALIGVGSTWVLHVRPAAIVASAQAEGGDATAARIDLPTAEGPA
jgi:uncharacterized protein (TIRG00374 family)